MPSKKKKYNARFPPARIKKIMQTDEEVGKVAAPVPVIISRALELFVESLLKKTSEITKNRNAKTLTRSHLKACILTDGSFDFLVDLVSSIPDVQGDEESSLASCISENPSPTVLSHGMRARRSRLKNTENDIAGPSHSTADESETWSAEEDGEEVSENSSEDNASDHQMVPLPSSTIPPHNLTCPPGDPYYLPHQITSVQNCSTTSSAEDDDYDS